MCGIVGYIGSKDPVDVLVEGLRRLEYRGYDSAGIALVDDGGNLTIRRAPGKLRDLEKVIAGDPLSGIYGIGHTRWATHGRPSPTNAHPHCVGSVALIHNGIVENHAQLRTQLLEHGCKFGSDTDSEIIAHLIHQERTQGASLIQSVQAAVERLEGSYAIAVIDEEEPEVLVTARNGGSPVIIGLGEGENFVASDIPAIRPYTQHILMLEDGEIARLNKETVEIFDARGGRIERSPKLIQWDPIQAEKAGYDRFMQKEIYEQPRAISDTIGSRVLEEDGDIDLDGISLESDWLRELEGVQLVACGTAWHACLIGQYMFERLARIPTAVDLASEFRYRKPLIGPSHLVIPVSQSGETADTLAALRETKKLGARSLAVCNVHDSSISREADDTLYTHAGLEIAVASTKCFTAQVIALYLIALKVGLLRETLSHDQVREAIMTLRRLPRLVGETLALWSPIQAIARRHFHARDFIFIGRGMGYPVALEGALKLKEISYIHAEGYAAGELKHGPIALIDENVPVVVVANQAETYSKVVSNAQEVRARGGVIIAVVEQGDAHAREFADEIIEVPSAPDPLSAVLGVVPLQILAYHTATMKGTDVDQPRNLAKSVTVE